MRAPRLGRLPFRALLLLAFILVGALLGGTALRAVIVLDQLTAQRTAWADAAMQLTANAQTLAERTVDMERAARQSLVLGDRLLRRRFEDESGNARIALRRLTDQGLPARMAQSWLDKLGEVTGLLAGRIDDPLDRERIVALRFRDFDGINSTISREVQHLIESRNTALLERLGNARSRLMQQVLIANALAAALAAGLGLWLARPFTRMEHAIVGLGENRLQDPIDIEGPADVRRVSQQLEWLRLRLTELDADKARFLRHVSHELKTPLAALREGVSLLEEGVTGELNPRQHEVTRILQHNAAVLQERIEALLRFNAAAFDARQLQRQPVDLLALLQDLAEAQRLQWQARGLHVTVTGEPLVLQVDPDKLGIALANLLANAIRFSPQGGTIRLALRTLAGRASVDVSDEGPGVAPPDRERIFEPFYRGQRQPEDAAPGTGIGLSIVKEYIAAHGGRIELLAQDNQPGAHFRIELPHA
ncbi:sensor histidine kinase [Ramlibacter sp. MMS24-I3-19]|uniref:sensor histidine kinase n=1 Tax=Ramlibacter sp. MMS24-I3-19 TaxID=3416606 RepID=UPI003D011C9A